MQFGGHNNSAGTGEDQETQITSSQSAEEGLVTVKEVNVLHASDQASSIPHLPSIPRSSMSTTGGLRKLQVHLARAQGEQDDRLEDLDEESIS